MQHGPSWAAAGGQLRDARAGCHALALRIILRVSFHTPQTSSMTIVCLLDRHSDGFDSVYMMRVSNRWFELRGPGDHQSSLDSNKSFRPLLFPEIITFNLQNSKHSDRESLGIATKILGSN